MFATMMKKIQRFGTSLVFGGSLMAVGASTDGCNQFMAEFQKGFEIGQQLSAELESDSWSEDDSSWYEEDSYYGEDDWDYGYDDEYYYW